MAHFMVRFVLLFAAFSLAALVTLGLFQEDFSLEPARQHLARWFDIDPSSSSDSHRAVLYPAPIDSATASRARSLLFRRLDSTQASARVVPESLSHLRVQEGAGAMSATVGQLAEPLSSEELEEKQGADQLRLSRRLASSGFLRTLRTAAGARSINQRIALWQAYLHQESDSTFRDLAICQLAEAMAAAADSSNEILQLADAVAYFKQNARVLRLLMGDSTYASMLFDLEQRLHAARISQK